MATPPPARIRTDVVLAAWDEIAETLGRLSAVASRITEAVEVIGQLDDADLGEPTPIDTMLFMYGMVNDAIATCKDMADVMGAWLIDNVPDRFGTYLVPGGGTFRVGGGKERKSYDNSRLISVYADRLRQEHEVGDVVTVDGELRDGLEVINAIIATFAQAVGATAPSFTGWRSGVAKEHGISLGTYADTVDAPFSHRIEGRERT